ncbi:MAG: hypothetical protein A2W00_06910 [Candidatus Eisenbacteria bacterium RBG_16_71_46]|nr:MAG: hypothetical protein A2W00_06910 [Candidatus Eisenbacteria bacterium RBG_16_71_46]
MSETRHLLQLHDLDLLLEEARDPELTARLRRLGFGPGDVAAIERSRMRLLAQLDARWLGSYGRALQRYGRGLAAVRDRVCLGCYITLPTSASPRTRGTLTLCESCGRVLYWH